MFSGSGKGELGHNEIPSYDPHNWEQHKEGRLSVVQLLTWWINNNSYVSTQSKYSTRFEREILFFFSPLYLFIIFIIISNYWLFCRLLKLLKHFWLVNLVATFHRTIDEGLSADIPFKLRSGPLYIVAWCPLRSIHTEAKLRGNLDLCRSLIFSLSLPIIISHP